MPKIDESRPFLPVNIAILTVSDTRDASSDKSGQVLVDRGTLAEVFYSASCGGRSESAAEVWPGADYPYLVSRPDDEIGRAHV